MRIDATRVVTSANDSLFPSCRTSSPEKIINTQANGLAHFSRNNNNTTGRNRPDTNENAAEKSRTWKMRPSLLFLTPFRERSAGESRTLRERGKRGKEGLLKRRQKGNRKRTGYDRRLDEGGAAGGEATEGAAAGRRGSLESSLAIGHPFRSTWDEGSRSTEKFNKAHAPD